MVSRNKFIYITVFSLMFNWCKSLEKIEVKPVNEHVVMAEELGRMFEAGSPRLRVMLSDRSGTSVYMIVYICGDDECVKSSGYKLLGAVLPENSSTSVLGEIFSYNLARVLGMDNHYGPGAHMVLRGEGLKNFAGMITRAGYFGLKENNRRNLVEIASSATELYCVYKKWDARPYNLDGIISKNSIDPRCALAGYLIASNPKPGNEIIRLEDLTGGIGKGRGRAVDLARQLSGIMLIDILTAQWDRWSGGNLQAVIVNGNIKLVAFDNGGTFRYNNRALLNQYLSIVSRFDKAMAGRLIEMNKFLNEKTAERFLCYTSEKEFRDDMGVIRGPDNLSNADTIWKNFKIRLWQIVRHINKIEKTYGAKGCYY